MEIGALIAVIAFGVMAAIGVGAGIIAAIAAVSGFDKPDDRDE